LPVSKSVAAPAVTRFALHAQAGGFMQARPSTSMNVARRRHKHVALSMFEWNAFNRKTPR